MALRTAVRAAVDAIYAAGGLPTLNPISPDTCYPPSLSGAPCRVYLLITDPVAGTLIGVSGEEANEIHEERKGFSNNTVTNMVAQQPTIWCTFHAGTPELDPLDETLTPLITMVSTENLLKNQAWGILKTHIPDLDDFDPNTGPPLGNTWTWDYVDPVLDRTLTVTVTPGPVPPAAVTELTAIGVIVV